MRVRKESRVHKLIKNRRTSHVHDYGCNHKVRFFRLNIINFITSHLPLKNIRFNFECPVPVCIYKSYPKLPSSIDDKITMPNLFNLPHENFEYIIRFGKG